MGEKFLQKMSLSQLIPIPSWLNPTFVPFNPFPVLKHTNVTNNTTLFMICAVAKHEERYVDEWLEYHKFLGFDYVMLHDNAENMTTFMTDLPKKHPEYVTIHHGPGPHKQAANYRKCIDTFQNTSTWIAFLDVDEFIVLRRHATIREYVQDIAPYGTAVGFNRDYFTSNHRQNYTEYPVLSRFLARKVPSDHLVKSIAYAPHLNDSVTHHVRLFGNLPMLNSAGKSVGPLKSTKIAGGRTNIAGVNHYFTKSFAEFRDKRHRGLAGHSEKNVLYQGRAGDVKIRNEFRNKEAGRTVIDTFAWDFYRLRKTAQLGRVYGEDFPKWDYDYV